MAWNGIFYNGVWSNGFDYYTVPFQVWDASVGNTGVISANFARYNGQGIQVHGDWYGKNFGVNLTTHLAGFGLQVSRYPISTSPGIICTWYDTTAQLPQLSLCFNAQGQLQFYLGGPFPNSLGAAIGSPSATNTVRLNSWMFIECKVTINSSTGFCECRVNGNSSPVISNSNVNTQTSGNAYTNRFMIVESINQPGPIFSQCLFDDIYMLDNTGSAPFNTYLGIGRIQTDFASGNSNTGGLNNFTPTNPQNVNWKNVANNPQNTAQYNFDNNSGDRESYVYPALVANQCLFLNEWYSVMEDAAGVRTVVPSIRSNSVDFFGPNPINLPQNFTYFNQVYTIDPNTSASFASGTVSAAGACELGIKVNS